jgi:hypothetical protein
VINVKTWKMKKGAVILSALMLVSAGIIPVLAQPEGFQLPNPGFTPGHPLYGLEMFIEERIEVPFAGLIGGREGIAEKRLRLAEERLAEIEAIANETNPIALERLRYRYEYQLNRTEALADELDSMDLDSWITSRTSHHIEVLTDLREHLPESAQQGIDKAIEVSARSFGVHVRRVAVSIEQIEGKGVNATQLKMELETLTNRTSENVMEFKESLSDKPPQGYNISIEIPELPSFSEHKGNETRRGPP